MSGFFKLILQAVPSWKPRQVNVDFEAAAILALKEVFGTVEVNRLLLPYEKVSMEKSSRCGPYAGLQRK